MAEMVLMPKVGISVESCIITQWLKDVGDSVGLGEALFEYETDKSSLECESTAQGVLLARFFGEGDEVPVLAAVCVVGQPGEAVPKQQTAEATVQPEKAPKAPVEEPPQGSQAGPVPQAAAVGAASPRARRLAKTAGVDITALAPSGPAGRVIERDVAKAVQEGKALHTGAAGGVGGLQAGTGLGGRVTLTDMEAAPPAQAGDGGQAAYTDISFGPMRRAISQSMRASLAGIPQLTHNFSFDASCLLEYRRQVKQGGQGAGLPDITLNDMILFATARLLPQYPQLNAHMLDDNTLRQFGDVNLGMAVDTPRGLVVPVIRAANHKSLAEIAQEAKRLAALAQQGRLQPDDMAGGSFSVSNLGMFGVESFTPVINPPQTGILGVDNIVERVRRVDGVITTYPAMGISLTYDHRAIDGAPASRFASQLCRMLEQFTLMLAP